MHAIRLLAAALAVSLATGVAGFAAPVGPVVNGDFEVFVPAKDQTCAVFGDTSVPVPPPPAPALVIVSPCETGVVKAAQWSSSRVSQFGDWAGADGDREVKIDGSAAIPPGDPIGASHNFWQAYPNPQQAYSANFESLRFRVEDGTIPSSAFVQLSLSTSPREEPSPFVGPFLNCQLTFTVLAASGDGTVALDPVAGSFVSRHVDCDILKAAWDASDPADDPPSDPGRGARQRREILGRTRIVQLSFWSFQRPDALVVLDGVEVTGGRLFVEDVLGL